MGWRIGVSDTQGRYSASRHESQQHDGRANFIASLEINNPDRLQGETWRIGWAEPTRVWMDPPGALMKP